MVERRYLASICDDAAELMEVYKGATKAPHDPNNMCPAFGDYLIRKLRAIKKSASLALGEVDESTPSH